MEGVKRDRQMPGVRRSRWQGDRRRLGCLHPKRLDEIGAELQAEMEQTILEAFRESLDRRIQQKIIKELGL
jgi:hypothetical protein